MSTEEAIVREVILRELASLNKRVTELEMYEPDRAIGHQNTIKAINKLLEITANRDNIVFSVFFGAFLAILCILPIYLIVQLVKLFF